MMKITLLALGKIKEPYLVSGIEEYRKRLQRMVEFNIIEIPETPVTNPNYPEAILQALKLDAQAIERHLPKQAYPILFDRQGKLMSSEQMAMQLEQFMSHTSHLVFIIGGSHGVHPSWLTQVKEKWSFSPLTFPHQLFRLMLVEQVYRSLSILQGHPYHK